MKNLFQTLVICLVLTTCLQAQCDIKVNKDGFAGTRHVETTFEWLSQKDGIASCSISTFYDGTPQIIISVCFDGNEHYYVTKKHEVIFHVKNHEPIRRNNNKKNGSKSSKYGDERCAVYTIPIDDELRTVFMKKEKECTLTKLNFSHSLGVEEIKIKKKNSKVLGNQVKCVYDISMDWSKK